MSKKFYQTQEFKELSEHWEKQLEKDGLVDIEKQIGDERALKQNSSNVYRQMEPTRREAKEIYFQQLMACVQCAVFDNEVDKTVMMMTAEGAKISEICENLIGAGKSRYRRTVRFIIRKYENRWRIRNWKPSQLKKMWKRKLPTQ